MLKLRMSVLFGVLFSCAAAPGNELRPERTTFPTEDGVTIVADYYPPANRAGAPVVILLHMFRSDRGAWRPLVPGLHEGGFAVLAIDLRGHGESIKPSSMKLARRAIARDEQLFNEMYRDVLGAYVWLMDRPEVDLSRICMVGASVGCSVALDYASRDRSVDAIVCLTPGERYLGVGSTVDIVEVGQRAMLLLATEGERQAIDALSKLNPIAQARVVGQGVVHGTHMFGKIGGIESEVIAFLRMNTRGDGSESVAAAVDGQVYFAVGSAADIKLAPGKRRLFSSPTEARARGLTGPDSPLDGRMIDTADRREDLPREELQPGVDRTPRPGSKRD
ncbi:MAG: alpha/beta fold hydrolase [bacterium]|nr:alpha/beta fold hydrolase [bacterium]